MADQGSPSSSLPYYVFERDRRFSESITWKLQRTFYEAMNVEVWQKGIVPSKVTTNTYIANAYAQVVLGWLRDCARPGQSGGSPMLDPSQPVYIVELGAGSGRFGYYFVKRFFDLLERSPLREVPVRYVLTDLPAVTLEYWNHHPSLQPLLESGRLDLARLDPTRDAKITLAHSGEVLSAQTLKNPLVVLANYYFDSVPHDIFAVRQGQLYEGLTTISFHQESPDLTNPKTLDDLLLDYQPHLLERDPYGDEDFNRILNDYARQLPDSAFFFPVGALESIRNLRQLSGGCLMILAGDMGYSTLEEVAEEGDPNFFSAEYFALDVNFHAIAEYIRHQGGLALHTSYHPTHLNFWTFVLGRPAGSIIETALAFEQAIERGNPDDFVALRQRLEKDWKSLSPNDILIYLRFSGWDPNILTNSLPNLLEQPESMLSGTQGEFLKAIQRVWENYYPLGPEPDLALSLSMLLFKMGYYAEGQPFLHYSLEHTGPKAETYYLKGLCHYGESELEAALESMEQALRLAPDYEMAKGFRDKIQAELEEAD